MNPASAPPGDRPTVREVAQRANVSMMTVSRVLNNESGVSPTTRARVRQAVRELEYVPNYAAKALANRRQPHNVAFLFDTPNATALGEMVSTGFDRAPRSNVKLVFINVRADDDPSRSAATVANLGIHGVILAPPLCDDAALRSILAKAGIRAVGIGCGDPEPDFSTIGIDDDRAAYDQTVHLLRLGHRRIGFIAGHPRHRSSERRRAGYEAALRDHGVDPDRALQWEGHYTFGSALAAAERALSIDPRPTAVFASNDDMAAAVVSVARGRGIPVPDQLSVCGFDDSEIARMLSPRLTTVSQPLVEMVRWAIRQLADELGTVRRGGVPRIRKVLLSYDIVHRESVASPPGGTETHQG